MQTPQGQGREVGGMPTYVTSTFLGVHVLGKEPKPLVYFFCAYCFEKNELVYGLTSA